MNATGSLHDCKKIPDADDVMHSGTNFADMRYGEFIVIFIIKTSVLLSRVLGKKWLYCLMGLQCAPLCACCFSAGISMSCVEAPYRPIDKGCNCFSCT